MDKKEVIKNLRRCANLVEPCDGCVYANTVPPRCIDLLRDAADALENEVDSNES